ncbi:hypothetical protein EDC94DRAFT_566474 [Helicostylum pulchrum]|nr:hypothetical protein EDC94DRAFT_566474 [Helicostylum pulchrum]
MSENTNNTALAQRKTGEEYFETEKRAYIERHRRLLLAAPTTGYIHRSIGFLRMVYGFKYPTSSLEYYERELENKNLFVVSDANYNIGLINQFKEDYVTAIYHYRKAAAGGHVKACEKLGRLYYKGLGVNQSHAESIEWYRLAAAKGDVESLFRLGVIYNDGENVPQDYAESLILYAAAARRGHIVSSYNIGVLFENGQGVYRNLTKAFQYYEQAAEQNDFEAQVKIESLLRSGYGKIERTHSRPLAFLHVYA